MSTLYCYCCIVYLYPLHLGGPVEDALEERRQNRWKNRWGWILTLKMYTWPMSLNLLSPHFSTWKNVLSYRNQNWPKAKIQTTQWLPNLCELDNCHAFLICTTTPLHFAPPLQGYHIVGFGQHTSFFACPWHAEPIRRGVAAVSPPLPGRLAGSGGLKTRHISTRLSCFVMIFWIHL